MSASVRCTCTYAVHQELLPTFHLLMAGESTRVPDESQNAVLEISCFNLKSYPKKVLNHQKQHLAFTVVTTTVVYTSQSSR